MGLIPGQRRAIINKSLSKYSFNAHLSTTQKETTKYNFGNTNDFLFYITLQCSLYKSNFKEKGKKKSSMK